MSDGYTLCYWPDRSVWLARIGDDGFVTAPLIVVDRQRDGSWSWRLNPTVSWALPHYAMCGNEPTRADAIEVAVQEAMRPAPIPNWHPASWPTESLGGRTFRALLDQRALEFRIVNVRL